MRTDSHSFGAFRYFIVPCEQMSLFDTVEEKRATAVNSFFSQLAEMKKRNWEIKGKKHLLVCNTKLSEDIFICKFSKVCLSIRNCIKRAPKSTVPGQHRFGF